MPVMRVNLPFKGQSGAGISKIEYEAGYNANTNQTIVTFGKCSVYHNFGTIESARIRIMVKAHGKMGTGASSEVSYINISSHSFEAVPHPKSVIVEHGYDDDAEKFVTISADVSLTISRPDLGVSSGSGSVTFMIGLASIVHVGNEVGTLYIFDNDAWRIGVLHVAKDGAFRAGTGHIPLSITVTYDEEGNVYLGGVRMTHDNAGNVIFHGVTVTDDGDGNITIT